MAFAVNMENTPRIYNGGEEYIPSDKDLMPDNSTTSKEVEDNFTVMRSAAMQTLSKRKPVYHWSTKNKSFLVLHNDLKKLGVKNNKFFLRIYDTDLMTIDPYSPILPIDMQLKVILECMINPWYFLREICRIPEDGMPIEVGGGTQYQIDRTNVAAWYLFLNGIDHYASKPRQTGKTQDALTKFNWAYLFGALSSQMLFFNKDQENATKNLYRMKCQRDMLPSWMQMRSVVTDDGKLDKGIENVKSMTNPVTKNSVTVMPSATSKESAMKLGRGATAPLMYYDEFDFIKYNIEIINAASFAYSRASENATKNYSAHSRIFTSTPGDLDNMDGENATEYISHMLKWDESMFDIPINKLKKIVNGPGRNRVVFVEHTWKQLKKSVEWYETQCGLVSFNPEVIAREIDLQRIHGSNQSPFKRSDVMYLASHKREPIKKLDYSNNLCPILIYEPIKRRTPYILAIDPSEGLAMDNNAFTLINPFTQKAAAEFKSPYISQPDMVQMCCKFLDDYCPRSMIVVENNRGREAINCFLNTRYKYQLYYDEGKLTDKVVDSRDKYGELKKAAYERRAYGFYTGGSSRPQLFAILETLVDERKDILYTEYIVDDILGLIRKPNTRVEAGPGKHDDNIMCYLMGLYIYYHADADFLEGYGIRRGARDTDTDYDDNGNLTKSGEAKKIKELLPQMPENMRELFKQMLQEKDPVKESWDYQKEVQRATGMGMDKLPSQLSDMELADYHHGITADPSDEAFWQGYDNQTIDSNFERNYDVNIDQILGDDW